MQLRAEEAEPLAQPRGRDDSVGYELRFGKTLGDKRELFLATLERYVALCFADANAPLGCFLIGTAATEAARAPEVRKRLGPSLRALTQTFEARFRAAKKSREICSASDPKLLADMAAAVLFSLALRSRAGDPRAQLAKFSRDAVAMLAPGAVRGRPRRRPQATRSVARSEA